MPLTYKDAGRIQDTLPGVSRVLPMRIIRDNVRFNQNNVPCQIIGTHPIYPEIVGIDIVRGHFPSDTDETHMNNVCALTVGLAERLFPYQDHFIHSMSPQMCQLDQYESTYTVVHLVDNMECVYLHYIQVH